MTDQVDIDGAVAYVQSILAARANPEKAAGMQTYMKTDMPFYGVQKPARVEIFRHLKRAFPPTDRDEYEALATRSGSYPTGRRSTSPRRSRSASETSSSPTRCCSTRGSSSRVPGGTSSTRRRPT